MELGSKITCLTFNLCKFARLSLLISFNKSDLKVQCNKQHIKTVEVYKCIQNFLYIHIFTMYQTAVKRRVFYIDYYLVHCYIFIHMYITKLILKIGGTLHIRKLGHYFL